MLLTRDVLEKIKKGEIELAFRRWMLPRVKTGSLINTAVGQIEISQVSQVKLTDIKKEDIKLAGYSSMEELQKSFYHQGKGDVYRIELNFSGPDPRIELRNKANLSDQELQDICLKLARYDKFSKVGPWTSEVLNLIAENPHHKAADLARASGFEKEWLKVNIRKLKNIGLTISFNSGYEVSPRGRIVLQYLNDKVKSTNKKNY